MSQTQVHAPMVVRHGMPQVSNLQCSYQSTPTSKKASNCVPHEEKAAIRTVKELVPDALKCFLQHTRQQKHQEE
jgi:hypothetical protein